MSLNFLRKPNDTIRIGRDYDNPDEDTWDDSELIKAYDASIKGFRKDKKKLKEDHPELAEAAVPGPWVEVNSADYAYSRSLLYSTEAHANDEAEVPTESTEDVPETYEGEGEDEEYEQYEEYEDEEEKEDTTEQYQTPSSSRRQPDFSLPNQFQFPNIFMPPMPNAASNQDLGKGTLPSLLMSWYMSGYHSGYFDAKQEFKREHMRQQRKKNPRQ